MLTVHRIIIVFVITVLCISTASYNSRSVAQDNQRINIFDKKNKSTESKKQQKLQQNDSEAVRQMAQSLEKVFYDGDVQRKSRIILYYGVFFLGLGLLIVGVAYWQFRIRRHTELAVSDPNYLVKELNAAHQLTRDEIGIMRKIAEENALPNVLDLFVEPKLLLDILDNGRYKPYRPVVRVLLDKLFGIETKPSGETQLLTASQISMATQIIYPE
jgi:hypothetical protein